MTIAQAHDSFSPEVELRFMIHRSQFYIPDSTGHFDSKIDYEQIQKTSPLLTKDNIHALLNSIDADKTEMCRVEEPPHQIVVEISKPKNIRFYFTKKKSHRPSPHEPIYHEEWDYILIGLKITESNQ